MRGRDAARAVVAEPVTFVPGFRPTGRTSVWAEFTVIGVSVFSAGEVELETE